jgi:hypothetical protein
MSTVEFSRGRMITVRDGGGGRARIVVVASPFVAAPTVSGS